jgi:glucuronosyltransferase
MFLYQVLLVSCVLFVDSYRILGLFPHRGKSHADVFLPLTKALARRGHQVTSVSHFPLKTSLPDYTDVVLDNNSSIFLNILDLSDFHGTKTERWSILQLLNSMAEISCQQDFKSAALRQLLNSNASFDVIIVEQFNSDCFLRLVHKFKAPVVGISSSALVHWYNERFGNPSHPAYIPNIFMDCSDRMSFFERVENLVAGLVHRFYYDAVLMEKGEDTAREYFGEDLTPLRDIVFNTSLLLVNTHFSLNLPRPLVPAVVEIGGIHVGKVNKLPRVSIYV